MDNIEKALQELAKAVERNDTVERVKVTITLVKPKPSKAKPGKQAEAGSGRETVPPVSPIITARAKKTSAK